MCLRREVISGEEILNHRGLKANNMHSPRPGVVKRDTQINLCPRSETYTTVIAGFCWHEMENLAE